MIHATLDKSLEAKGEAYIVLQADGTEKVFDNYIEALTDSYDVPKVVAPMTEERKAVLSANLEKARGARSERAKEKAAQKQEAQERKRAENPTRYDEIRAKRIAALEKARAARKAPTT